MGACVERQTLLLDLKVKEKKKTMAELEGEPQNHLEGMGVVIHNEVSLSDDKDLTTGTPHSRSNHYVGTPNLAHARNPNLPKNIYIGFCREMEMFDGLNINCSPTDNTSRPEYTNICISVNKLM